MALRPDYVPWLWKLQRPAAIKRIGLWNGPIHVTTREDEAIFSKNPDHTEGTDVRDAVTLRIRWRG